MKILIDADPIVYQVGFAGEERWYELAYHHNGEPKFAWFYNKDRLNRFVELCALHSDEYEVELKRESEPLSFVLATVKRKLNNIFAAVDGFLAETGETADEFQLYLTDGKSNFRNKLATIVPYKGNRDPSHKPIYYTEIRDYMVERWDARIIRGAEADDALSIAQYQAEHLYDTCICSIDKDLKMVPGLHYNYLSKQEFYVDEDEAIRHFYTQLLMGDATDNIKGCYLVGEARARKITQEAATGPGLHGILLEKALYEAVLAEYRASIKKHGDKTGYAHMGAEAALLENARLLWMQQWPGQLWTPPGEPWETINVFEDS